MAGLGAADGCRESHAAVTRLGIAKRGVEVTGAATASCVAGVAAFAAATAIEAAAAAAATIDDSTTRAAHTKRAVRAFRVIVTVAAEYATGRLRAASATNAPSTTGFITARAAARTTAVTAGRIAVCRATAAAAGNDVHFRFIRRREVLEQTVFNRDMCRAAAASTIRMRRFAAAVVTAIIGIALTGNLDMSVAEFASVKTPVE